MKRDKSLIRATLDAGPSGPFPWFADVHTLSNSQRVDLHQAAKTFGYRKGIGSYFSLGAAFFLYLCKDPALQQAVKPSNAAMDDARKRWSNDGIAS